MKRISVSDEYGDIIERIEDKRRVRVVLGRTYVIEKAGSGDALEILSVINTSNREAYKKLIPGEYFREPFLSLEKFQQNIEGMALYVCRSEGRIVGVAALSVENEELGKIRWVYVLPEYQRKGTGTALVTRLEQKAKEMGLKRIRLVTVGGAEWAVSFYRKLGYELAGRIERLWGSDVSMEKTLQHCRAIPYRRSRSTTGSGA